MKNQFFHSFLNLIAPEHAHFVQVALKEELLRQEKLEQLAFKFERKSVLREGYLNEMIQVIYFYDFPYSINGSVN